MFVIFLFSVSSRLVTVQVVYVSYIWRGGCGGYVNFSFYSAAVSEFWKCQTVTVKSGEVNCCYILL